MFLFAPGLCVMRAKVGHDNQKQQRSRTVYTGMCVALVLHEFFAFVFPSCKVSTSSGSSGVLDDVGGRPTELCAGGLGVETQYIGGEGWSLEAWSREPRCCQCINVDLLASTCERLLFVVDL